MRKIIAILLAILLISAISTTVLAASPITGIGGTDSKDVKGTYQEGQGGATVYSVDVSWGAMEFTYTDAATGTWNPATHTYSGGTAAAWSWTAESNKITVTNHSNAAVSAGLSFAAGGIGTGIAGSFFSATTGGTAKASLPLATAVGTAVASAPTDFSYFQITGGSVPSGTLNATIGAITVTLN